MKVTKLGHCCLLIECTNTHSHKPLRILTDPGNFSDAQNIINDIDLIVISHEHADHLHIDSLVQVMHNNPQAQIVTNTSVHRKIIDMYNKEGVSKLIFHIIDGTQHQIKDNLNIYTHDGISIEGFDARHEEIFEQVGQVQNTAFLFDETLFYPGDAYAKPDRVMSMKDNEKTRLPLLALPVAGGWCRIKDAIYYALEIHPVHVIPIHDGMLQVDRIGGAHRNPQDALLNQCIEFTSLNPGQQFSL
jgi:L-ascorbate metabolism protein UlaG (beta-lactamase superfamily)